MLDAAVEVFWQKGFEGSSMDDLTDAMGINRPSLYGAFGGKKELYLEALQRYGQGIGSKAMNAFLDEPDIRQAVTKMLSVSLECQTRPGGLAKGCMFASCAPASLDSVPEAQSLLREVAEKSHSLIAQRFESEVASGKLPKGFSCNQRADWLLDMVQAQAYRARTGESREKLQKGIESRVQMVLI